MGRRRCQRGPVQHGVGATNEKKIWEEFKGFLNKGDFITIAVGLVLALYFQHIVDALLQGVINPIIAAIFWKPDYRSIGFDIVGDARISIGLVIDAIITFIVVGFLLFLILKAYDRMRRTKKEQPDAYTAHPRYARSCYELQRGREASKFGPPWGLRGALPAQPRRPGRLLGEAAGRSTGRAATACSTGPTGRSTAGSPAAC